MDRQLDLNIIPEFNETGSVVEWLKKLKLVSELLGGKRLDRVIPPTSSDQGRVRSLPTTDQGRKIGRGSEQRSMDDSLDR